MVVVYACRYSFFDTDNMIELAHNKMPVSDIFKQYGEEYFRSCERQVGERVYGMRLGARERHSWQWPGSNQKQEVVAAMQPAPTLQQQ